MIETGKTVYVQYDESTDEYMLPLPEDMCGDLGWCTGDTLVWSMDDNGAIMLTKKDTPKEAKFYLVETVSQFRERYMIEANSEEEARAMIGDERVKEFSQQHIGETIFASREVSAGDVIPLCDKDNSYTRHWEADRKFECFVTMKKDYE